MTEVVTAAPSRRRTPAGWFADQNPRELALWGVLIAAALVVRLIGLGDRAFHHDESQDAYFSFLFRQTGDYEYNPLLHGPLRFYLTALMYVLFGDSDFTARLAPALMGLSMIPLCWPLRPLLGRIAAFAAAVLFAFGPSYLYFSRFAREDIYVAALTLALIVVIWRFLDKPRTFYPALIGLLLAASFATKETTFITVFVMGSFFLVALAIPAWRDQVWGPVRVRGLGGLGLVRGRVRRALHAAVHDLPDASRRALGRRLHRAEVLAGPARGGARRRARGLLLGGPAHDRMAGADPRHDRRRRLVAQAPAVRRLPGLGLLRLAGRLLVGGREVRVARPAPAAARDPARRCGDTGHLGDAREAALGRASWPPRSGSCTSAWPRGG